MLAASEHWALPFVGGLEGQSESVLDAHRARLAESCAYPGAEDFVSEYHEGWVRQQPMTSHVIGQTIAERSKPPDAWMVEWDAVRRVVAPNARPEKSCPYAHVLTGIYLKPWATRHSHDLVRGATAFERETVERRLATETQSFSSASLADMLKLLSGQPSRRSQGVQRVHARERSLWDELRAVIEKVRHVSPVGVLARDSAQLLIKALRRARAKGRSRRAKLPVGFVSFVGCAAANAELGSAIMRHGPPVFLSRVAIRLGVS